MKIGNFSVNFSSNKEAVHEENIQPFQCLQGGEMMDLSNFYQNYSVEADGNILAWYPNGKGIVIDSIEKQDYCININHKVSSIDNRYS